jgi:hypothetical protein
MKFSHKCHILYIYFRKNTMKTKLSEINIQLGEFYCILLGLLIALIEDRNNNEIRMGREK